MKVVRWTKTLDLTNNLILDCFNYSYSVYDFQFKANCTNVIFLVKKKKNLLAQHFLFHLSCPELATAACWMVRRSSTRDWGRATMVHLTLDLIAKSRNYLKKSRELSFPDYLMKLTHLHFSGKDIEDIVIMTFSLFISFFFIHMYVCGWQDFICRMTSLCAETSPCCTCMTIGYHTYATWALPPTSPIYSCRTTPSLT